ncbi:MAG: hypothetical protein K2K84_04650 [Muribaculaceae bacterium]|nr:hypothetical protein [Muribaculaceae bacterium]
MKKFFVIAALAASMSLVSCGGDKGEAEASVTGNAQGDSLVELINACNSMADLQNLVLQNQELFNSLPADVQAQVDSIATVKAQSFVAVLQDGAAEIVGEEVEVTEVPEDAVEAAQAAGEDAVEAAKAAGENVVEKAKAAGEAAVEKANAAGEDAVAKAKAAGEDAAAKAKAAAKGLGL